jgi:hypothetical protein
MNHKALEPADPITQEDLDLSTFEGFETRWLTYRRTGLSCESSFDKATADHVRVFGREKYASYDSFRQVRTRNMKKVSNN